MRYKSALTLRGLLLKFLRRKPNAELALLQMLLTCWLNDNLESIVTPKYLAEFTSTSCLLCKKVASLYGTLYVKLRGPSIC